MRIKFSPEILRELAKIKSKDKKLAAEIERKLDIFIQNPKYPSLRVHKLDGKLKNMWSMTINPSVRVIYFILSSNEVLLFDIGTHDEVYKEN